MKYFIYFFMFALIISNSVGAILFLISLMSNGWDKSFNIFEEFVEKAMNIDGEEK